MAQKTSQSTRSGSPATRSKSKCKGCNKNVPSNSESLECDHCSEWWHRDCGNVSKEDFIYLKENPLTSVKWFCKNCKSAVTIKNTSDGHGAQCDSKIDNITKIIQTMQDQMSTMQQQMALVLDLVKKDKDEKPVDLEKVIQVIEDKVDAKLDEKLDDRREKEEKRNNMIMFNIGEAQSSDVEGKEVKDDIETVREVLSIVHPDASKLDLTEITVTRCGTKKQDKTRPIKVKLMDNSSKGIIFKNSWKLKETEKFKKVGITNDKTEKELLKDRTLRAKMMDKRKETGEDDWIIYKDEIIKRSDRPPRNQNNGSAGGKH